MFVTDRMKLIAGMALSGASALSTRFGLSDMRAARDPGYRKPNPRGCVRLVAVPEDRLEAYLAGRVRDQRSYSTRDKHGTHPPVLRYFTHVNFSKIYKRAMPGQRECRRRCPGYYVEVNVS